MLSGMELQGEDEGRKNNYQYLEMQNEQAALQSHAQDKFQAQPHSFP